MSANFVIFIFLCKIELWDASYDHLRGPSGPEVDWKLTGSGMRVIYNPCDFLDRQMLLHDDRPPILIYEIDTILHYHLK